MAGIVSAILIGMLGWSLYDDWRIKRKVERMLEEIKRRDRA